MPIVGELSNALTPCREGSTTENDVGSVLPRCGGRRRNSNKCGSPVGVDAPAGEMEAMLALLVEHLENDALETKSR